MTKTLTAPPPIDALTAPDTVPEPATVPVLAETGITPGTVIGLVCQYCNWAFHDGWGELLKYDETYQSAVSAETDSTHGFHEEWDDLRGELGI